MLKVVGCLVESHDYGLVALAALVCAVSAIATIRLARHARLHAGRTRAAWIAVAAVAGGSGIWSTHFVAMLAFDSKLPVAYDLGLTSLSLLMAVFLTGAGLAVAVVKPRFAALGGAILGAGVGAMHFTGMMAFEVPGRIEWDPALVGAALMLGATLGAASLAVAVDRDTRTGPLMGALLLLAAICSLHFTAMGAVTILPDPSIVVSSTAAPPSWVAIAVALASMFALMTAAGALALDLREQKRETAERERMRSLANAAVEGLVVCGGGLILNANDNFAALVGEPAANLSGREFTRHFPDPIVGRALASRSDQRFETELRLGSGASAPVELVIRVIGLPQHGQHAIAVRDLRDRRRAEQEIAFLARHDPLTGLPNRASFDRRLDETIELARAGGGRFAVLCVDLDRFKEVNDLFGHQAGDHVLQTVARAVSGMLAEGQMAARLGGDEFAIVSPVEHALAAGRLAERVLAVVAEQAGGASGLGVGASIGVALFPDDAEDRHALLNHADIALYRAKGEGRGGYRFFEAAMGAEIHDRRALEHDLRLAPARNQLSVVYQPQTETATGEIFGFEALLRWTHPTRGVISPASFIPLAEESGAIIQIGEWALREACREAASWERDLSIAVNVSAVQLHSPNFAGLVHEILFTSGLAASRLEIEITETALVRDLPRALTTLRRLKALGLRVAMDDFGTGYSSLSNLRAFPFDKIKIDRSFVKSVDRNEQTAAIVRSVLGLGRGLGLPVLAEGVETEAEMRFLESERCDAMQGFLLGRPSPIEDFRAATHDDAGAARESAATTQNRTTSAA